MVDGQFALALTAGMIATVNPCGFAMLPAYLTYFVGLEGEEGARQPAAARVARALAVGLTMSLGFVIVFGTIGVITKALSVSPSTFTQYARWPTIVIGLVMIGVGIALMLGWHLPFATPRLDRGGRDRSAPQILLFGISYAIASISCAFPVFLGLIVGSFARDSFASGVIQFLAYAVGMALVITALTVTLALAEGGLLRVLRVLMTKADRIAGAFLTFTGAYLVWYWGFGGRNRTTFVEDLASRFEQLISDQGAARLVVVLGGIVAAAVITTIVVRRRPRALAER